MLVWRVALAVIVASSVAAAQNTEKFTIPDVDNDPEVMMEQEKISDWTHKQQHKISKWHQRAKVTLKSLQDKELVQFEDKIRLMKCNEMKRQLGRKLVVSTKSARALASKRNAAAEKAKAVQLAREIFSKVSEPAAEDEQRLKESLGEASRGDHDSDAWLKAIETSDPDWQRHEERKMDREMRTDPQWRSKMDNKQGDGGISWTQHTTRLDTAPQLTIPPSLTALVQTSESVQEPLLREADVMAIESLGKKQPEKKSQTPEQLVWEQFLKNKQWRSQVDKKEEAVSREQRKELHKVRSTQQQDQHQIKEVRDEVIACSSRRDSMYRMISDTIMSLPISEEEKQVAEKPLLADMEDWLACHQCKKPKPQETVPWPDES